MQPPRSYRVFDFVYRIAQNVGRRKNWQIWQLSIDSPKFSHPSIVSIVNTLKCNGKPSQFAEVLPFNYMSRVILPKFHPANILRHTVVLKSKITVFLS